MGSYGGWRRLWRASYAPQGGLPSRAVLIADRDRRRISKQLLVGNGSGGSTPSRREAPSVHLPQQPNTSAALPCRPEVDGEFPTALGSADRRCASSPPPALPRRARRSVSFGANPLHPPALCESPLDPHGALGADVGSWENHRRSSTIPQQITSPLSLVLDVRNGGTCTALERR